MGEGAEDGHNESDKAIIGNAALGCTLDWISTIADRRTSASLLRAFCFSSPGPNVSALFLVIASVFFSFPLLIWLVFCMELEGWVLFWHCNVSGLLAGLLGLGLFLTFCLRMDVMNVACGLFVFWGCLENVFVLFEACKTGVGEGKEELDG